jgi:hypothetical protein
VKKYLPCILLLIFASNLVAQIFSQNFNSSTNLTDYYNSTPSANQFRLISTTNSKSTVSVATNKLIFSKIADTTTQAYAERNVDFVSIPTAIKLQFSFSVTGGSAATSMFLLAVGSNVTNGSTPPTLSNIFARIAINTTNNSGEFVIRDIKNTTNGIHIFTGTQTITWILNHYGNTLNYSAPDGSLESIADGKADLWVGNIKEFDDISTDNSSVNLARFKFYTNSWTNGTSIMIDDIIIQGESALPVQLTSFTAGLYENKIKLNWSTATEVNNYGFDILRQVIPQQVIPQQVILRQAQDDNNWEKIGFVQGHGNSNSPKDYLFVDAYPPAGKVLYKLKQIDFDGAFEYSKAVEVNVETPQEFRLAQNYPNPFNPSTVISYQLPMDGNVTLKVYDMLGKEVTTLVNEFQRAASYNYQFSINNLQLSSGVYYYRLQSGNFVETKKFIVMK